jgi:hypothetical protein
MSRRGEPEVAAATSRRTQNVESPARLTNIGSAFSAAGGLAAITPRHRRYGLTRETLATPPAALGHSVCGNYYLSENRGTLEHAQTIDNHQSPGRTELYDRTRLGRCRERSSSVDCQDDWLDYQDDWPAMSDPVPRSAGAGESAANTARASAETWTSPDHRALRVPPLSAGRPRRSRRSTRPCAPCAQPSSRLGSQNPFRGFNDGRRRQRVARLR